MAARALAMMMMARRTNVPALIEAEIVDVIAHWCDLVGPAMTSEAARRIIEHNILQRLQAGTLARDI